MNIGIRELKAKLSEYLSQVADGEEFVITDRGIPVAKLVAYVSINSIELGIEQGWIEPAKLRELPVDSQRFHAAESVPKVLEEDRS